MRTVKLTNSFHNTSIRVRVPTAEIDPWTWIQWRALNGGPSDKSRERRVRRALCGMPDCECGTVR